MKDSHNITYHGELKGRSLEVLYHKMHIGIGAFNTKVKGLNETSSLKAREYLNLVFRYTMKIGTLHFPMTGLILKFVQNSMLQIYLRWPLK